MQFPIKPFDCLGSEIRPEEILKIAEKANIAILNVYENPGLWEVQKKEDFSPLTEADLASNEVIRNGLKSLSPKIPLISEEEEIPSFDVRKDFNCFWQVDPLDGTKEFIKRNGQFTVNIALIREGIPIFGIVTVPVIGDMYIAAHSQGAFRKKRDGPWEQIRVKDFRMSDPNLVVYGSSSHSSPETQRFMEGMTDPEIRLAGSSLKFMKIAEGEGHLYPRFAPTNEWDISASDAIVREAGGSVVQVRDGKYSLGDDMEYNKPNLLNPHFIVFGKMLSE